MATLLVPKAVAYIHVDLSQLGAAVKRGGAREGG